MKQRLHTISVVEAFENLAEVLAKMDLGKIVSRRASKGMSQRVETLINRKKEGTISKDESVELERFLALDLLINLAKARAKRLLAA
ncbi:MAG: hypothetical protein AAF587_41230 [Bacteroidota bacterium]